VTACPQCLFENRAGVRFCEQCGAQLDLLCPACGAPAPADRRFCGSCGESLGAPSLRPDRSQSAPRSYTPRHLAEKILATRSALEGERKQVTVLFCDIANSTALAERVGPEIMHALLNGFFELALAQVHRYEGTINQFLGDGFMALFGAPIAHEDHARRAVLAALAIQRALRERPAPRTDETNRLVARMGLNSGLVVVGSIGDNLRMDYTAVGDTTNLAARMQQLAAPRQICLTESVRQATRHYFDCDSLGERLVKGKADPIPVYLLRSPRGEAETVRGLSGGVGAPLIGRAGESSSLRERMDRVLLGHGGVVAVLGEAGLGKSRLIAEARRRMEAQPARWLEGRGLSFGQTMSYRPFLEIIRAAVGITENDGRDESWAKLDHRLAALFPDAAEDVLPYLATLLGVEVHGPLAERVNDLDAEALRQQLFRTSRRFIERLARERPLVLVFEDWHWADVSSAALLEHLLSLTETVPLLICWTGRPDPGTPAAQLVDLVRRRLPDRYTEITLSPLTPTQSAALLETLLKVDQPARLRELILRKAEGNPFFIEEVVRSLIATGTVVREADDAWRVAADLEQIMIPDTLQGVIMARVDRLDEDTKQVLKLASVIGRGFSYRVLHAVAGPEADLDRHLGELQRLELIRERSENPELEYIFKHALVQEATYESILTPRRRRLHRRVGECTETLFGDRPDEIASRLAYHYARAEAWDKALINLRRAGDHAGRVAADAEALMHYEQAIAASGRVFGGGWDPFQRAVLERKMAEALFRRGDHHQTHEYIRRALRDLGESYPSSRSAIRLGILRQLLRQVAHRVLALLPGNAVQPTDAAMEERAHLYSVMAWVDYFGNHERFILDSLMLLNASERCRHWAGIARGSTWVAVICDHVPLFRVALHYHRYAVASAGRTTYRLAPAQANLGLVLHHCYTANWEEARDCYLNASAAFRETGALREWAAVNLLFGQSSLYTGRYLAEVRERAQEMIQVGRAGGDSQILGWGLMVQGIEESYSGRLHDAVIHLQAAIDLFEPIPSYPSIAAAAGRLGHCHLRMGQVDRALAVLKNSARFIVERRLRSEEWCTLCRSALAEALLMAVDRAEARERTNALNEAKRACNDALKHCRTFRGALPQAARAEGSYQWLRGRRRAAYRAWHRSLALAEAIGARWELGATYLEMGKRLRNPSHLESAERIFTDIDAKFDLAVAHRLLGDVAIHASQAAAVSDAQLRFERSIAILRELQAENELALAYAGYGRLHKRLGRIAEARDYLTRALQVFERLGGLVELAEVRTDLTELPRG